MGKRYFILFSLLTLIVLTIISATTGCINLSVLKNTDTENTTGDAVASGTEDSSETSISDTLETPADPSDAAETIAPESEENVETPSANKDDTALKYTVVIKEINELESEGKREIIAEYPYFVHDDSEEIFYTANTVIKNEYIDFWINDFRNITDEVFEYMREDMPGPLGLEINYSIEYMDNRCISVLLHNFSYSGGAHPYAFTSSYNYDIEKRKDIMLDDLFLDGYDYLSFLSSYCYESIKNNYTQIDVDPAEVDDWILEGTDSSDPDNFKDFNITADSLMISFDPYEVGPYVMGAFTVYIPYGEFGDNILYP